MGGRQRFLNDMGENASSGQSLKRSKKPARVEKSKSKTN